MPETHDPAGGVELPAADVLAAALDSSGAPRDGVTVTGGVPFLQPAGLLALVRGLRAQGCPHVLWYSGYGQISPRNCFAGGRTTSCRVNTLILRAVQAAEQPELWFAPTPRSRFREQALIVALQPDWNIRNRWAVRGPRDLWLRQPRA